MAWSPASVALFELKSVRQFEGEMLRRWFDDDEGFFDLIAWMIDASTVSGFQLAYDVSGQEQAVTWLGGEFSHRTVDAGDDSPLANDSSILGDGTQHPLCELIERFSDSSQEIDPIVRNVVIARLNEFARTDRGLA